MNEDKAARIRASVARIRERLAQPTPAQIELRERVASMLFGVWAAEGNDHRTWESLGDVKRENWRRVADKVFEMCRASDYGNEEEWY